jgi:hypothetical protein
VLPSTAKDGAVSRIVPTLDPGTLVSTSKNDVNYVVTEYGVAQLRGKSVRRAPGRSSASRIRIIGPSLEEQAPRAWAWHRFRAFTHYISPLLTGTWRPA